MAMNRLLYGPIGCGKTTALLARYEDLVNSGVPTGKILVLVLNAPTVSDWRSRLSLAQSGSLNIFTYFGFAQREITRCWREIESNLSGGTNSLEPTFMTTETAQYLMGLLVEEHRALQYFPEVRATAQQISIQLIDNLNQASLNGLSLEEAGNRLLQAHIGDKDKIAAFEQSSELMSAFRRKCIESRCIDYSLTVDLFNSILLAKPDYLAELNNTWEYLLVDNLEETVPAAQDLIAALLKGAKESILAFDPTGGHGVFFGADPQSAQARIFPLCEVEALNTSYIAPPALTEFAQGVADKILTGAEEDCFNGSGIMGQIFTQLRGDMIKETGQRIAELVEQGIPPEEIAVITPTVDKVLEFSLGRALEQQGITLVNLTRGKRLLDQPFAQALVSLALLVYPEWRLEVNFSGLVQTLSILLKLDPVRSALLAEEIFSEKLELPDIDKNGLRARLGFENAERYQHLKQWSEMRKAHKPELEHLFQQVFGELLAPLMPGEQDLLACRQVIDSVTKFYKVMAHYPLQNTAPLGKLFLDMVLRGTLAAETLYRPPENTGKVVMATPFTFLFSPFVKPVRYQFWVDVAGEGWFRGYTKELTNPYLMSPNWQDDMDWDDQTDQQLRLTRLARMVQGLLGKCSEGLYISSSYLNSQGREQEGRLAVALEEQGGKTSDSA
jgi:hypothetical protein